VNIGRIGVVALALCLALIADSAQSQRGSRRQPVTAPSTQHTQPTAPDQRGTDQSPLIVKIARTPKTDEERTEETKERERKAESDRNKEKSDADLVKYTAELASFTERLFYATVVLGLATIGLLLFAAVQSRDTKASISVARANIKALMNAEEAHLFIAIGPQTISGISRTGETSNKSESASHHEIDSVTASYLFKNIGRTAAILKELSNQIIVRPTFPTSPAYPVREQPLEDRVIEPGKSSATFVCLSHDTLTIGDAVAVHERRTTVWFYGYATFDDVYGREHRFEYRYCYRRGFDRPRLEYFREFTKDT
jgi:hypothetical protein